MKTLGERDTECIFVGYVEYSKAFRFYVTESIESVSINSIIESRDVIFDESRFSLVSKPSLRIPNGIEDIDVSEVSDEVPSRVTKEVADEVLVQQPEPELRKRKRNMTTKNDDSNTFDEAMKSWDDTFWKEAINDEMDSIKGNNTWVLADLPPGCKPLSCK
nr:hypothetical protein [Tanacetum cinerariifolium]